MLSKPYTPHCHQGIHAASKRAKTAQTLTAVLAILFSAMLASLLLTSCGQKGALYLPKDAPSNTEFILYKGNKAATPAATSDNQATHSDASNSNASTQGNGSNSNATNDSASQSTKIPAVDANTLNNY